MLKTALVMAAALSLGGCQTLSPSTAGNWANPKPLELSMVDAGLQGAELAAALIVKSDQRCEDYLVGVTFQKNVGQSLFSVIADALGTVGGLSSEARTANAFAASSLFANNTGRTLGANIFGGRDFSIIYDAVKRGRTFQREMLLNTTRTNYIGLSRHEVLAKVVPYDLNCGISYGLSQISVAVSRPAYL